MQTNVLAKVRGFSACTNGHVRCAQANTMPEGPLYKVARNGYVEASVQLCRQAHANFQPTSTFVNRTGTPFTLPPLDCKCASLQTQVIERLLASGIHPDDESERDKVSLPSSTMG